MNHLEIASSPTEVRFWPEDLLCIAREAMQEHGGHAGLALIDTKALTANFETLQKLDSSVLIFPVLKSDAYGHGAEIVVAALAEGAKGFCISENSEAESVRRVALGTDLVRMKAASQLEIVSALQKDLGIQELVGSVPKAQAVSELAVQTGRTARLQIKLDCGNLGRGGFDCEDAVALAEAFNALFDLPNTEIASVTAHHPDPESINPNDPNDHTIKTDREFARLVSNIREIAHGLCRKAPKASLLSSAGLVISADSDANFLPLQDSFARVGGALFGFSFQLDPTPQRWRQALHAITWVTDVVHRPRFSPIGYFGKYRVEAEAGEDIATIGLGWETFGREYRGKGYSTNYPHVSDFSGGIHDFLGRQSMNIGTLSARSHRGDVLRVDSPLFLTTECSFAGVDGPTIMQIADQLRCQPEFITSRLGNATSILRLAV